MCHNEKHAIHLWGHSRICYVTLFSWKFDPHPPPRTANNVEPYTFVTLFSGKADTPPTPYSTAFRKAGFIRRTKIYAVYADHFAHVGRVFSATNADLRRSDRADGKYKHSYNTPTFMMNGHKICHQCSYELTISTQKPKCILYPTNKNKHQEIHNKLFWAEILEHSSCQSSTTCFHTPV